MHTLLTTDPQILTKAVSPYERDAMRSAMRCVMRDKFRNLFLYCFSRRVPI